MPRAGREACAANSKNIAILGFALRCQPLTMALIRVMLKHAEKPLAWFPCKFTLTIS